MLDDKGRSCRNSDLDKRHLSVINLISRKARLRIKLQNQIAEILAGSKGIPDLPVSSSMQSIDLIL